MKTRDQYKRLLRIVSALSIVVIQTVLFALVWYIDYAKDGSNYYVRGNYVIVGLYAAMIVFFYYVFGGFEVGRSRAFEIFYSQALSILVTNVIAYLQLCLFARWILGENMLSMLYLTGVELVLVLGWSFLTRLIFSKLYPPRRMLLVYGAYSPYNLMSKIQSRTDRYDIAEYVSIDSDFEEIKEKILACGSVVLTDTPAQKRNLLLKFCFENDIRCYCVPKISDILIRSAKTVHLMDTELLLMRNLGLTAEQRAVKRVVDVLLSLIAIALASPFMLIIALCVKLYDGGPVFFRQDRLTRDGKVFQVFKFRSMKVRKEEEEYVLTRKDDDRITPVGKIIRNIHFDELPQLFNILKGDMSIVGPRPECPHLAQQYKEVIPQFDYRLKVKAGLTGYAQVYGKYNTTPYDKLKMDLHYIQHYTFFLDIKLILLTVKILFQKENTEGIEDWQTSAVLDNSLENWEEKKEDTEKTEEPVG